MEYLTEQNIDLVSEAIERFIIMHEEETKLKKLKAVYQENKPTFDDTFVELSQST
jgi:hypothetical protein